MIKLLKNVVAFIFIAGVSSAIGQQITGGGGVPTPLPLGAGALGAPALQFGGDTTTGFYRNAANQITYVGSGSPYWSFLAGLMRIDSATPVCWGSGNSTTSCDIGMARNAAGVMEVNTGSGGAFREVKYRSAIVGGTVPGISGCSAGTQTGGGTAGTFTIGAATCNVTLTFAFTAPTGWSCAVNDRTTAAAAHVTSSTTTTAVIAIPATAAISDVVDFHCAAY